MLGHRQHSKHIKEVVYGATDGIITTFAVIVSAFGAQFAPFIVLIIGFANLLADGFSMASSDFLASHSEEKSYEKERERELKEIKEIPDEEINETREIFLKRGYGRDDAEKLTELISKNKEYWADFMMKEELFFHPDSEKPVVSGLITFVSFTAAGFFPLISYLIFNNPTKAFYMAVIFTAAILFVVGSLRTLFSLRPWYKDGFEMLLVGAIAAGISYGVSIAVKNWVGI